MVRPIKHKTRFSEENKAFSGPLHMSTYNLYLDTSFKNTMIFRAMKVLCRYYHSANNIITDLYRPIVHTAPRVNPSVHLDDNEVVNGGSPVVTNGPLWWGY